MIEHFSFIISCIIVGIILFQSFFIAPSINKIIDSKEAAKLLRYIWPKFFISISVLSFFSLLINYYIGQENTVNSFIIVSIILMLICYFITPLINKAKDNSKNKLWTVLHLLSIILTLITLILNVLVIFYWKLNA